MIIENTHRAWCLCQVDVSPQLKQLISTDVMLLMWSAPSDSNFQVFSDTVNSLLWERRHPVSPRPPWWTRPSLPAGTLYERNTHTKEETDVLSLCFCQFLDFDQRQICPTRSRMSGALTGNGYLSSRMDSVFLSFSSHVSFSSAMIFSVSCSDTHKHISVDLSARQDRHWRGGIIPAASPPPPLCWWSPLPPPPLHPPIGGPLEHHLLTAV